MSLANRYDAATCDYYETAACIHALLSREHQLTRTLGVWDDTTLSAIDALHRDSTRMYEHMPKHQHGHLNYIMQRCDEMRCYVKRMMNMRGQQPPSAPPPPQQQQQQQQGSPQEQTQEQGPPHDEQQQQQQEQEQEQKQQHDDRHREQQEQKQEQDNLSRAIGTTLALYSLVYDGDALLTDQLRAGMHVPRGGVYQHQLPACLRVQEHTPSYGKSGIHQQHQPSQSNTSTRHAARISMLLALYCATSTADRVRLSCMSTPHISIYQHPQPLHPWMRTNADAMQTYVQWLLTCYDWIRASMPDGGPVWWLTAALVAGWMAAWLIWKLQR